MRLPKFIRYLLLINKIKKKLPRYHQQTGQKLSWNVAIRYKNIKGYDSNTGESVGGFPSISVKQKYPFPSNLHDFHVYVYNFKKRLIQKTGDTWPRY